MSSVSMIWPCDCVSQCHVDGPQRREEHAESEKESDEQFSGDDLADEMSRLNILSFSSPSTAQERETQLDTEPMPSYPALASPRYRSLNSIKGSSWDTCNTSYGAAPAVPTKGAVSFASGRTAKYRNIQDRDEIGLSQELVNAIFGGITRKNGGKRLACLRMDDSGRWRVVRYSTPEGLFPSNVR